MLPFPSRFRHIKFQQSVFHGKMPALAHILNMNASARPFTVIPCGSRPKPHRIPDTLLRQSFATLRVTKVAEFPQFL